MSTVTYNSNTPPTPSSDVSSTAAEPCTACKYQHRQCNPDCQRAPYFPAGNQRQFINAHRLFGICNILKTLNKVGPSHCAEAMRTIIFESDMWVHYLYGGCYHIILSLTEFHQHLTNELALTKQHIDRHRSKQQEEEKEEEKNTADHVKPMVESGAHGVRRMNYFVARRILLLLCSLIGLALLVTSNGTELFPPFVSLDAEFSRSLALVCFLVVTILGSFSVISIPSLPPRLMYLLSLCSNPQLLRELKIFDKHRDSVSKRCCGSVGDLEEGLKKQKWLGEDGNKTEIRENLKI